MKKLFFIILALVMCTGLVACGGSSSSKQEGYTPAKPLDLSGTWVQINSNSDEAWQEATIADGTIEINWISDKGETKSLYWSGTYEAPTKSTNEYEWTSKNDKEKTDSALLASGADTKDFTYKDGVISYEASAMGTTTTIKLERQ